MTILYCAPKPWESGSEPLLLSVLRRLLSRMPLTSCCVSLRSQRFPPKELPRDGASAVMDHSVRSDHVGFALIKRMTLQVHNLLQRARSCTSRQFVSNN